MSKKTTPWYNPINDDYWNGYYAIVTPLFIGSVILGFLIIEAAIYNTITG